MKMSPSCCPSKLYVGVASVRLTEKGILRCIHEKMKDAKLNTEESADLIWNFNKIKDPGFEGVKE
jgi:hypothetical protein